MVIIVPNIVLKIMHGNIIIEMLLFLQTNVIKLIMNYGYELKMKMEIILVKKILVIVNGIVLKIKRLLKFVTRIPKKNVLKAKIIAVKTI
jgi:hypothetical protein